jgi:alkylated DNA repair dioxygenase AlkB
MLRQMPAVQSSLFEVEGRVGPRALVPAPQRTLLGGGAWVDVQRDWMAGSAALFERLIETVPWLSERRRMYDRDVDVPRLLAFYDDGETLPDPALEEAREALDHAYRTEHGAPFHTTGICLYRNGSDSVAWHGDTIGRHSTAETLVAIVSLGEPRRFLMRPRTGRSRLALSLGHGDLLVMGGTCQRTWEHSVPKTVRPVGPRISVQFRSSGEVRGPSWSRPGDRAGDHGIRPGAERSGARQGKERSS